jgi:hypothetical protein
MKDKKKAIALALRANPEPPIDEIWKTLNGGEGLAVVPLSYG